MSNEKLNERLKTLKTEDFIWVIYIGIILASWYSNALERKYLLTNDKNSKERYRTIMLIIFSILVVCYLYFLNDSYKDLKDITESTPGKIKELTYLSFIGSLLVAISGVIFLYIIIQDQDLNVEIAFN